jgi:glycosyltransferase involved in cell wall biosynthesis
MRVHERVTSSNTQHVGSPDAASPSARPAVSVVVAVRNGAQQLPILFEALSHQTLPRSEFEVIVVDDDSSDGTAQVARESGLARVFTEPHVGKPRAVNIGVQAAAGELIALTDADVVPDDDWLERGARAMRDPAIDILGGAVTIELGTSPSIAALVDAMNWLDQRRCCEQGFPIGANVWTRRETFERWGLLNEEIPYYHNDAEWGKRATGAGAKLVYARDVHVAHPARARLSEVARKAYGLGVALAPHRRPPLTTVGDLPPLFLRPTPYLPPRRLRLSRLNELGMQPSAVQKIAIYFSQWVFVMLPMLVGDVVGEVGYARNRRRERQSPPPVGDGPPEPAPRVAESP